MGTAMAPTYANIFVAVLEKQTLKDTPNGLKPFEWIRLIDDIFALWTHGTEILNNFINYVIKFHHTIKFDYTFSHKTVNFLDKTIYFNENSKFESELCIKTTDRMLLLHNDSYHPPSTKKGIIYNQALRCRRIITNDQTLQQRLDNLSIITKQHHNTRHDTMTTSIHIL